MPGESQRPDTWREATLSSIAEVRFSSVDKITHPSEESVRLCNYIDVYDNDYITSHLEFMRASATRPEIAKFGLQVGDVIITKDSETPDDIGIPAVVDYAAPDLVCGYHLGLIRPNHDEVDSTFLAKQLSHHRIARYFGTQANGLTRYGLPIGAVNNTPLWLPEHNEQKAIGLVLRLVDEAIAKTEAVVAKLKHVRAGLLHDLLTRGLDEHGRIRDPIAHPEQFQDSPVGRIPTEWRIESLAGLFDMQLGKMLSPKAKGGGNLRPYVGNRHVLWERCDCTDMEYMDFTGEERSKFALRAGDLLVCEGGEVGRTALWRGEIAQCYFQKAIHRLRPKDDRILPEYMLAFMKRAAGLGAFTNLTSQTSIAHLTQEKLALLSVALPPREEQSMLVATWSTVQAEQDSNEELLGKLTLLKSGLMADLLTGRVRVPEEIVVAP
jgi:type I restriction enzyme, S subunit